MIAVTSPSSDTRSVLDASVVVRALVGFEEAAVQWMETAVAWPSLVYVEFAHVMHRLHRSRVLPLARARDAIASLRAARSDTWPVESLVQDAWEVARTRDLSVYDACYIVLAEALGVPLVTADRRLADATPNGVMLS